MSVAQDRLKQSTNNIPQPEPLPPDVKIIECSLSTSDYNSDDNSTWTNILKEPITVKKGSEIRVATNFIDQRGIDSDIIQFQSSGAQQDNSHVLLTQAYTCNDGFNGKTTTYDYIGRDNLGVNLIDPGQNLTINNPPLIGSFTGGNGSAFNSVDIYPSSFCIRPGTTQIQDPGKNYNSNDTFRIKIQNAGNTDYEGKLICNDLGEVIDVIFTSLTSNASAGLNYETIVDNNTNGTGLVLTIYEVSNGISILKNPQAPRDLGTNYKIGDIISLDNDSNGPIPEANKPKLQITNISSYGAVSYNAYMDQGYNYEKSLVSRWAQTFDINKDFVRGKQLTRNKQLINSIYENDDLLSAAATIQNKEDEFAPGIYHTGNNDETFRLYAPVIWITKDDVVAEDISYPKTNFSIYAGRDNNWLLSCDSYIEDNLEKNVLNTMPIGSVYQIQCLPQESLPIATEDQVSLDIYENIGKNVNMTVRIKELIQYEGSVIAVLDNSVVDYVGAATQFQVFNKTNGVLPANLNNRELNMELYHKGDLYPNGVSPTVIISTDANGVITNFSIGDGGSNNRTGMIFRINDFNSGNVIASNDDFILQQVDNTQGWNLPASRLFTLNNNDLVVNSGGANYDLSLYLIPVFQFSDPILTPENRGNQLVLSTDTTDTNTANITSRIHVKDDNNSGLFKASGNNDDSNPKLQVINVNNFNLKVNTDTSSITQSQITYQPSGDIIAFGDINDADSPWFRRPSDGRNCIRFNRAHFTNFADVPRNTILTLEENGGGKKVQVQLGDVITIDPGYYDVDIICADTFQNQQIDLQLDNFTVNLLGFHTLGGTFKDGGFFNNLNGDGNLSLIITYSKDLRYSNTELLCEWNNQSNVLPITSPANFFNTNDINGISDDIKSNINVSVLNSYNQGGFYFISSYNQDYQTILDNKDIQFNNGVPMWGIAELPAINNLWRQSPYGATEPFIPNVLNQNQIFTTITDLWEYQPLYRQKELTINKSFVVPSDIAGIWTREAHELSNSFDFANANVMTQINSSGLLQNEFIMPVYGSNNPIGLDGMYIKNTKIYNQSSGLEPGHCIGINYVNENNGWLCGNLMHQLPTDKNGNKYYNIYFRTSFTFIRGYNPFATQTTFNNSINPDRTPLTTLNQTADKIGNANKFGESSKKSLFGDTMLAVQNDPNASPPTNNPELIGYEQGNASGNGTGSTPVQFGTKQYYPINYLNDPENYPRAKISQYVGSQNLALIFDSNVSTFTFQYFHSPFTSPFVDDQGGENSIRIFFGNRKPDIQNNDTLGGLNVINYCRPNYSHGTYTYLETISNNLNPKSNTDTIGKAFLNKLGFTDSDIGITNNKINGLKTGTLDKVYTRDITKLIDGLSHQTNIIFINSINRVFLGTTGSNIDSSDAILTQVPSPEISAGLESYTRITNPAIGQSQKIIEKFGDMIYYPYSINQTSNSFNDVSLTRFDNATGSYGAVGGLLLSNSAKGMTIPNTLGSTVNVDDDTVPVQLNPDCQLYLAFTVQTESSAVSASLLPNRLSNAYMVVLSSIMKQGSMYLDSAGWVNGMSVISKTFLTGDFILSQGQFQFYAANDFILSEITTQIVDNTFNAPTSLGNNSTVIYSITNYNPVPDKPLPTIEETQQEDMLLNQIIEEHQNSVNSNKTSDLQKLNNDLYDLGLSVIEENNVNILDAIKNQIATIDLPNLTPRERIDFLQSPEGITLTQNANDMRLLEQHLNNPSNKSQMEIKRIHDRVKKRTNKAYFKSPRDLGRESVQRAGYTPEDIQKMESFGEMMKMREQAEKVSPVKQLPSYDSGFGGSRSSEMLPEEKEED